MPFPTDYEREYSFTGFASGLGDGSFPGSQLDGELDGIAASIEEINALLGGIAQADGTLATASVGLEQLKADVRAAIGQPATLANYADDTAAASGGVAVGGFYRTGSAVKVRVS
jgi:hypothetical protein